jgi:hypothetical protein
MADGVDLKETVRQRVFRKAGFELAIARDVLATCATSPREIRYLPRAVRDRSRSPLIERRPWWPYNVERYLRDQIRPGSRVFEYGGGGSTLWLLDRGAHVTTVEHDPDWHRALAAAAAAPNAEVLLRAPLTSGSLRSVEAEGYFDDYVKTIRDYDERFDLVIVDGRARVACVLESIERVVPGGMLLLDDSQRRRYRPALDAVATWPVHVGRGIKAGPESATTRVWTRPL